MKKPDLQTLRQNFERYGANLLHRIQLIRLRTEQSAKLFGRGKKPRVMATACWSFPIYSQTFVYQELTQLIENGFEVRFLYSNPNPKNQIPEQFTPLWNRRIRLILHPKVCEEEYSYYKKRMPEKIDRLVDMICSATKISPEELRQHHHFLQAFSFARMVEAYRPDYLHSYFFYEGTLFTFVASYLLDIPRGVSCYADHMLDDYALKAVPLHLEQCDIVISTSEWIKNELLEIANGADPSRIIVKPNAINSAQFTASRPEDPKNAEPYRLICVSRIEPKKGLIYLVEAVRLISDRELKVELHLIGGIDNTDSSKEYSRQLERKIRELDLEGIVHLHGVKTQSDIKQFFSISHLFAAPFVETEYGDKDGIPTSMLEAMASGLPVVATDAGSICEVIEDGHDGIIVPQRDSNALADTIADLLNDPERRASLSINAARKVLEKFDVTVCEQIFHNQLSKVLASEHLKN